MPDRQYQIIFTADTANAVAGMKMMHQELQMLEAFANSSGTSINNLAQGVNGLAGAALHLNGALGATQPTTTSFTLSIADLARAFAIQGVMSGAVEAVLAFGDVANRARDRVKDLAIETMDLRDKMRELANLQKQDGPNNEVTVAAVKLGMAAGMMPEEAVKYLEQFEGSSPAGEQKGHIDEATKKAMMVEGAKFGTRVALKPQTAGDLAGVISQYTDLTRDGDGNPLPPDARVEKGMAQMGRVAYGLNEGRGNLEPLVRSLINTAGAVITDGHGPVEDLGELAAVEGVASTHANPREAGTRVRQAVRSLRDTKGKAANYFESVGIKDGMTHIQRLERLKADQERTDASGEGFDTFLKSVGLTDEDEGRAIVEQVRDLDIIKKRVANQKKMGGRQVIQQGNNFLAHTRTGVRRQQKANKAGQEFLVGEQGERFEMAREAAEQQLRDEKKIGGPENSTTELAADLFGLLPKLGYESTREATKAQRAEENLIEEAKRKGIDEAAIYSALSGGKAKTHDQYTSKPGDGVMKMLNADNPFVGTIRESRSEGERLAGFNKLADEVEQRHGAAVPAPPQIGQKLDNVVEQERINVRAAQAAQAGRVMIGDGQWIEPQTQLGREATIEGGARGQQRIGMNVGAGGQGVGMGAVAARDEAIRNGDPALAAKLEKLIRVTEETNKILLARQPRPAMPAPPPPAAVAPGPRPGAAPKRP